LIKAGVFGASGYTGFELINLLMRHPGVEVVFATSESAAGQPLSTLYPTPISLKLIGAAEALLDAVDVALLCLPHGASAEIALRALEAGARVIDLSADFRLDSAEAYAAWYGKAHPAPERLPAVYGLTEVCRSRLPDADLVANPGCYPTGVLLGLMPLAKAGLLGEGPVIADCKSGVSGAGRSPKLMTSFAEVTENLVPYNIGHTHRHVAEMEQELAKFNASPRSVIFSPHLLPVARGILATLYVGLSRPEADSLQEIYRAAYAEEPFVWVLPAGQTATLAHVNRTNRCALSIQPVGERQAVIVACIDNLVKGAAGQAVQNLNVMFGLDEEAGLVA
jgi:N-acetyl-gamma-glutamyl-phosphate reductase